MHIISAREKFTKYMTNDRLLIVKIIHCYVLSLISDSEFSLHSTLNPFCFKNSQISSGRFRMNVGFLVLEVVRVTLPHSEYIQGSSRSGREHQRLPNQ